MDFKNKELLKEIERKNRRKKQIERKKNEKKKGKRGEFRKFRD